MGTGPARRNPDGTQEQDVTRGREVPRPGAQQPGPGGARTGTMRRTGREVLRFRPSDTRAVALGPRKNVGGGTQPPGGGGADGGWGHGVGGGGVGRRVAMVSSSMNWPSTRRHSERRPSTVKPVRS